MALDERRRDQSLTLWALCFAIFGALVGFAALLSGLADSGYASPSARTTVLGILAFWPDYLCGNGSIIFRCQLCDSLRKAGNMTPVLYVFGIPMATWAMIGLVIGYYFNRRRNPRAP
jgi:hypothetical protein